MATIISTLIQDTEKVVLLLLDFMTGKPFGWIVDEQIRFELTRLYYDFVVCFIERVVHFFMSKSFDIMGIDST